MQYCIVTCSMPTSERLFFSINFNLYIYFYELMNLDYVSNYIC